MLKINSPNINLQYITKSAVNIGIGFCTNKSFNRKTKKINPAVYSSQIICHKMKIRWCFSQIDKHPRSLVKVQIQKYLDIKNIQIEWNDKL